MMKSKRRTQRHFIARKLFDGSAAVRAPEVFKENTSSPRCFIHVMQPTDCVAMLRPCGFVKI